MISLKNIDHIVYCVPDLDLSINTLSTELGVTPIFGGRHQQQGTQNAIFRIGPSCYLEILAIDQANRDIVAPRWMGIDDITTPTITRWCVTSDDIYRDASSLDRRVIQGQRALADGSHLSWQMTDPEAQPPVDIIPFFIDWSTSAAHPTDGLPLQCELQGIKLYSNTPSDMSDRLQDIGIKTPVMTSNTPRIEVILKTAHGLVIL